MDDKNQISERTDPAIKLFGKSIQLPETSSEPSRPADAACGDDDVDERRPCGMDSGVEDESDDEGNVGEEMLKHERENGNLHKPSQQDAASGTDENLETPVGQSKTTALSSSRTEETKSETTLQQETPLKKPEKIIPCPRCASMDTKFCYFNNHNVNQPRYFCRKCQRYWTSGGTMRNLPVGAGRRKSKSSAVHYPLIAVPVEFQSASASHTNGVTHRPVALNGSVLNFVQDKDTQGSSSPKIVDKPRPASALNGSGRPKECKTPIQCEAGIVVDDNLSGSAGSFSNIENGDEYKAEAHTANSYQCFQPQMLYIPAPLWPPYPWNPALTPVNYRPGFPVPVYPAPIYMGCALPGAWNMPWSAHSSSPNVHSDDKSPILGKRSRDDNVVKPSNADEGNPKPYIWIPKTLRLDDLEEAAKSSMWATLGIKNDNTVSSGCKGHFKPFSSLAAETSHSVSTTSSALLANPAALSRSMNFHESS